VLEVEIIGAGAAPGAPPAQEIEGLCRLAAASAGIEAGHVAIEFVDGQRIQELNREYRGKDEATDVLSFPIDGIAAQGEVPLELGDVVISPAHTRDLREAIVHGVLHLVGMDHEVDQGEMLALQAEILRWEGPR